MEAPNTDLPFELEFYLLDVDIDRLRPEQKEGYLGLMDKLKDITSSIVLDLGEEYCTLNRAETVIASSDHTKQLRGSFPEQVYRKGKLRFQQNHQTVTNYFTLQEVIQIGKALRFHIEKQLHYSIGWRIVLAIESPGFAILMEDAN